MGFIDSIIDKAAADRKTIVLPETADRRVLEAAAADGVACWRVDADGDPRAGGRMAIRDGVEIHRELE